jgi:histidyl-tRNA synthetase
MQVLIGHKIPIDVPLFSEDDIESSKFKAYDSSILRLLNKWAEELRNKIVNAEETIYRRRFKFKSNRGRLINLEPTLKDHLYHAAMKEIEKIEEYLEYLKQENFYLQTVFAEEEIAGKYSKNDTKVGVFAAKIN